MIGSIILTLEGAIALFLLNIFWAFVCTTILGIISISFGGIRLLNKEPVVQEFLVKESKLREWQCQWKSVNGTPEKLLPPLTSNQNLILDFELNNYSFDCLVVCQ
ncbi:hypothetical protein [Okeania sp.]|uniref:hypothetical protein n=1 Tax=Okeania sp. TaxID=3100323 RepID=UPI002B4B7F5A|nr:hypothetical protein [Okeania sp.]MEB3339710.1 hypothetical protein [Okeania sp.]